MTLLGLSISLLGLTIAAGEIIEEDKNSMWRPNELMMTTIDNYYKMLAVRADEANDRRKRFISIFSQAYMYYKASEETDNLRRVQDAVNKTRRDLDKPADAIAGQIRAYLVLLKTPFDQHINDIRAACPPKIAEADCLSALERYKNRNLEACKEYNRSLHLYAKYRSFWADPDIKDFFSNIEELSDNNDEIALDHFTRAVLIDYADLAEKGRQAYLLRTSVKYPCSIYNLPLF